MLNNRPNNKLITERIISEDYAFDNLTKIFPSSLVLSSDFRIVAASDEIERIFKYNDEDLVGNAVTLLMKNEFSKFQKYVSDLSQNGYFISQPIVAYDKFGEEVYIKISGFYLGLLSDLNDMLVIIINDLSPIRKYRKKIKQRESEFNELIYRTHHEIKGPIATIKGLLNILAREKDSGNSYAMLEMLKQSISLLDHRITNIAQFHEFNTLWDDGGELIDLKKIEKEIKRLLSCFENLKNTELDIQASHLISLKVRFELIRKLLVYLFKAISFLPVLNDKKRIVFHFSKYNSNLKITVNLTGFLCTPEMRDRLLAHQYSIEDAIKDDAALRFYVIYNHIMNMDGKITYSFSDDKSLACDIIIPL